MEQEVFKALVALVIVVLVGVFFKLQFKIAKTAELEAPEVLPDESEVIGKDLPIGFRFVKNGCIIEVVKSKCNQCCVYYYDGCDENNAPSCVKTNVIFKKVTDGSEN